MAGAAVICGSTLAVALLEQRRAAADEGLRKGGLLAGASGIALASHGTNGRDCPEESSELSAALAGPTAAQWSHLRRPSIDG